MKTILLGTIMILMISNQSVATPKHSSTCTGAKNCKACKNCKYCKHCSKNGGSCGVCK
jgi:hypothetical protein